MAAVIPFIQVAAAVVGAIGAIRQGQAARSAADYNAAIAEQNAQAIRQQSEIQTKQIERENFLRLGSIRAAQGKAGGDTGQGSVLDVIGDAAAQGELDKQNSIYRAELQARGYQNTAALDTFSGRSAQTAGFMKAGSELLGGGTNAYVTYNKLSRT